MPLIKQQDSIFKNRYCGAYWQSLGLNVIPSITWSDERSFKFCFLGIPKNSCVAISTIGNRKAQKEFMIGYEEMFAQINPEYVICFGKPFDKMYSLGSNIIYCPYHQFAKKHKEAI